MEFLESHWHCILPVIAIAVVMFVRRKSRTDEEEEAGEKREGVGRSG
ncbi:MAG: hypothetical protein LBK13_00805 [Spirochaetales bacterium]|jgi:hypothetical protein|nr:hypothetical protein [Spirochaetales bacterium]